MNTKVCDINAASPPTLDHVVGQRRAVRQLKTAIEALVNDRAVAHADDDPTMPHLLFVGPPGVGKTLLANIVARELAVKLHEELAQNLVATGHMHGFMLLAEPQDILFLDEIHELMPAAQTILYRALEEGRLFLPSGVNGERQVLDLPSLTFVGATTDEWALTKPLRDRFRIVIRLEHYSDEELAELIAQRARRLDWSVTDAAVRAIAVRGRGTPRLALRLLEATRRTARAEASDNMTLDHVRRMAEIEGVDQLGLDPLEQRYLQVLKQSQGPVRLNILATKLGLPRQTIERIIESDLIRLGLIAKEDSGRVLTADGRRHVSRS
ncbi:AAA family ATPase [Planctomycetales bacterium ZRK34]|nr:AAA family ATPase [Planctomycetales bacterium ZRK34]